MADVTTTRVQAYLDELDRALSELPRGRREEIVRDIRGHIEVALADLDNPSDAAVEQVLDSLGTPAEIAEAAYLAEADGIPDAAYAPETKYAPETAYEQRPRPRMATRDVATVVLLLIGGIVLPVVGWVIGLVLLWSSTAWRTRDKLIGTLLVPGGLLGALLLAGLGMVVVTSTGSCETSQAAGAAPATVCTSSGSGAVGTVIAISLLVVCVLGPFFTLGWLIRTARRPV
jgi:uncharacterized membrane protein